jgi:salicylate hydroxylase
MEDAQSLGTLFSRIRNRDHIAQFLNAYEEIRQPRVSGILEYEIRHQAMLTSPAGPAMEGRDAAMRHALAFGDWEHMDEETFKMVWGTEVDIQSHDAAEQIEDWWTQWGGYFERENSHRKSMEVPRMVQIQVM